MDDLKLYGKNDYELEGLLRTIKTFSDDIGMTFGLDKCAKATFTRGKLKSTSSIEPDIYTKIKELDQEATYKYLGIEEGPLCKNLFHFIRLKKISNLCVNKCSLCVGDFPSPTSSISSNNPSLNAIVGNKSKVFEENFLFL